MKTTKREYYPNGQLMYEWNLHNGKREGIQKTWHENGQLWCENNYHNGKPCGTQKCWYDNSQLKYNKFILIN